MGSEMCIRDRSGAAFERGETVVARLGNVAQPVTVAAGKLDAPVPVSYTHLTLPTSDLV